MAASKSGEDTPAQMAGKIAHKRRPRLAFQREFDNISARFGLKRRITI
jgi:hypothetical protein